MNQIGNIPAIVEVKEELGELQKLGLVANWELPYENLLTRLTAAIFFITPVSNEKLEKIWEKLSSYPMLTYRENKEKKLSSLEWRVEFNKGFQL